MRRNFAQILKDAKIDVKVEYQKLYGMLYDRSIQVSNTSWISAYDEFSTYFIAFHFRGTCLSLDEFNDLHGFHFEKDPTNFNIDHLISLCEYIENLLMAYQCVPLSYPYGYGNMPTKLINVQFYLHRCYRNSSTKVSSEGVFQGRTVVIATGASPRPLGVPGEEALTGKGVHYCAACDGAPYRGRTVAVVGGGNSAAADALTLSRIAKKVYLIHRRDSLRATKVYHEPLMNAPNVEFCWNSTVSALLHESRLTGLRLKDVNTGAERELACDGVFISVGRAPATELFRDELALDSSGYIMADESTRTSLPGVFAAGDVRTKALRQVVTAVSDGAVAVHYAEEYLAENR